MRHLRVLLVITLSLAAPANLFAQAVKPAPPREATKANSPAAHASQFATEQTPRADDFYRFVSNQRWGTYLQVRLKSKLLFHGTRAEVALDYFVVMHRGKSIFIPFKDVASITTGRTFWQQAGRAAMWPLKGAMYAVIIPVGLCVLGFHVLKAKIQGKDPWEDK